MHEKLRLLEYLCFFHICLLVCLFGEGRPRLDLESIYGAHKLADEGAFTSVVVFTASFPSGFRRDLDLNQPPSL